MGGYAHIRSKYGLFLIFSVGEIRKISLCKTVILHKNLKSIEFTNKKHGKPTLHCLIANHVLKMPVKLQFQCVNVLKRGIACFALVVLNQFSICFHQGLFTRYDLHAETKMIYESMNLKGVVY